MKRTKLRSLSTRQAAVNKRYREKKAWFLAKPENKWCWICIARGKDRPNIAVHVHHYRQRSKLLTDDERFFVPSCAACDLWPHENVKQARELGLLAPATECGLAPRPGEEFTLPRDWSKRVASGTFEDI